ncbi:MAG: 2-oxoacid:acceptor oxidoreductase subunit alpha [Spirochaetes bacterium]|nr:2-oxoacid:acceptor oxidoreductase subunit alpha [Spirochaetota bacterium]MBN2769358.1 2-oxoacid:acceptor oxidoreductase subunit alpha [Spirochaetota bacterium]
MKDISIVIAGEAGQGVQTVEEILVGILKKSGYHICATKEYESRVRGGSNSTQIRISDHQVAAFVDHIDLLIPFNAEAFNHCVHRLSANTIIIIDPANKIENMDVNGSQVIEVKMQELAKEMGNAIYVNTIIVGIVTGLFLADKEVASNLLQTKFNKKGEEIVKQNIDAFESGFSLGEEITRSGKFKQVLVPDKNVKTDILINGAQAVGLGAIAGGCNFISAYPMSPSTGVLQFLAANSNDFEIVIDQAEDEIAALNKTVAAWYAGARALASTSGGGFALMTEALSLAGMMESPAVLHIAQRPGPATGLPTRTAQEDLNLVLYAGHGEFQRIIFAPGTIEEAFYLTQRAFNIADQYQVPVFILTDQDFVDRYNNIPELNITDIKIEKHHVKTEDDYQRYKFTDNGLSPRGIPGYGKGLVRADSDEHDEQGHITEDMDYIRPEMVKKRFYKRLELIEKIAELPTWYGPENPKLAIICWGSTLPAIKESVEINDRNDVAIVHFHQIYPLPADIKKFIEKKNPKKMILVEANASGQFANLLKIHADISIPNESLHLRFSGKPFSVEEITEIIEKEAE